MGKEKRQTKRTKCKIIADLICEGEECGQEKFETIQILDESETGMCISSNKPVDVSELLSVSFNDKDGNKSFPAEFVWTHKSKKHYLTGLKKI